MKKLLVPGLLGMLLAGCAVGPNYKQPVVAVPEQYREVQGPPAPAESLADLPWWETFKDPVLRDLIDEALRNGYDVRIAAWRVDEARARAGIARSEFFPQIGYGGDWSRRLISTEVAPGSTTRNLYSANVNFGWELDLWGRIRRLNESARAQYLATEEGRRGVVLSLVSEVAATYFTLRGLDELLVIAKSTVASFDQQYKLFSLKLEGGAASAIQTSYAGAALGQVAAQVPDIERQIEATENRLSLLLGRNPGPIPRGGTLSAQAIPPKIPAGLPSDLLKRRPDILQAEQQLVAANAQIGAARAQYFPAISLSGALGSASTDLSNLFKGPASTWNYAGSVVGPIFTAGLISGQVAQAEATRKAALFNYQQTIQAAFADVSTALSARQMLQERLASQEKLVRSLQDYSRLARLQYEGGYAPYSTVLQAEQTLFPAELTLATLRAQTASSVAAIYKALGGGWVDRADAMTRAAGDAADAPTVR